MHGKFQLFDIKLGKYFISFNILEITSVPFERVSFDLKMIFVNRGQYLYLS
jgi:hypothetical protein